MVFDKQFFWKTMKRLRKEYQKKQFLPKEYKLSASGVLIELACYTHLTAPMSLVCEVRMLITAQLVTGRNIFLSWERRRFNICCPPGKTRRPKTHVSSMIPSARPTDPPVVIIIFTRRLFCDILKSGLTYVNLCENNDHYWPGLWVGRVDQKTFFFKSQDFIPRYIVFCNGQ